MNNDAVTKSMRRALVTTHSRRRAIFAALAAALYPVLPRRGEHRASASRSAEAPRSHRQTLLVQPTYVNVFIVDGYVHEQVHEQDGLVETLDVVTLEFFPARRPQDEECQPSIPAMVERARSLADGARLGGIEAELAALAIPDFELVLQSWQAILNE